MPTIDDLQRRLDSILNLHQQAQGQNGDGVLLGLGHCRCCREAYPCDTRLAAEGSVEVSVL